MHYENSETDSNSHKALYQNYQLMLKSKDRLSEKIKTPKAERQSDK